MHALIINVTKTRGILVCSRSQHIQSLISTTGAKPSRSKPGVEFEVPTQQGAIFYVYLPAGFPDQQPQFKIDDRQINSPHSWKNQGTTLLLGDHVVMSTYQVHFLDSHCRYNILILGTKGNV
jgi:hypothetical protein